VAETYSDGADHLRPGAENRFVAIAQSHELDTAMHVPGAEPRRLAGQRHRGHTGHADEAESLVAIGAFVVVGHAEAKPYRNREIQTRHRETGGSPKLE